jgi:hypothetical protein
VFNILSIKFSALFLYKDYSLAENKQFDTHNNIQKNLYLQTTPPQNVLEDSILHLFLFLKKGVYHGPSSSPTLPSPKKLETPDQAYSTITITAGER